MTPHHCKVCNDHGGSCCKRERVDDDDGLVTVDRERFLVDLRRMAERSWDAGMVRDLAQGLLRELGGQDDEDATG
jgi:hypothetical protein